MYMYTHITNPCSCLTLKCKRSAVPIAHCSLCLLPQPRHARRPPTQPSRTRACRPCTPSPPLLYKAWLHPLPPHNCLLACPGHLETLAPLGTAAGVGGDGKHLLQYHRPLSACWRSGGHPTLNTYSRAEGESMSPYTHMLHTPRTTLQWVKELQNYWQAVF